LIVVKNTYYNRKYKHFKLQSNTKEIEMSNSSQESGSIGEQQTGLRPAKVIYFHGFEREDVFKIIKAIKSVVDQPGEIAFSTSTPTNLEWKIKDMVAEVREDHAYFKEQEKKKQKNK
jgi:hypothetical protein